ncbi:MAG: hypothetical protein CMI81_03915 [Candidatus Pelagibacter sp.]|nr:hypothetical protein [Candidatus Pelagibacter sp.]|tara:strand:- start:4356 stop:4625 length:270 start_codon:yes stop_codon:yes gene_type:complete
MKKLLFLILFSSIILLFSPSTSDEIIKDHLGNYYLMRNNGTFKKLPPPKPGHKYIVKKKIEKFAEPKKQNKIFKRVESLKNVKQNKGSR